MPADEYDAELFEWNGLRLRMCAGIDTRTLGSSYCDNHAAISSVQAGQWVTPLTLCDHGGIHSCRLHLKKSPRFGTSLGITKANGGCIHRVVRYTWHVQVVSLRYGAAHLLSGVRRGMTFKGLTTKGERQKGIDYQGGTAKGD